MTTKTFADFGIFIPSAARGQVNAVCPHCDPTRTRHQGEKDLRVNTHDGVWYCQHCGWTGSLKSGDRVDTGAGSKPISQRARTYDQPRPLPDPHPANHKQLATWLGQRGISEATADAFHLSASVVRAPQDGKDHVTVHFPYFDNINHINTKHRTIDGPKHYWQEAGCEQTFYNLDRIDPEKPLIITEGEIDALSIYEAGFPNVVSVPGGAPETRDQNFVTKFQFMERSADLLESVPEIILATDNDGPGKILEDELARRGGVLKSRRVIWPDDINDPNDALVKLGKVELHHLIANAPRVPVKGLTTGEDLVTELEHAYHFGWDSGSACGLANLDKIARLATGYISVWTGHSGSGKSTALDNVLIGLAQTSNWRTALYSPEQMPLQRHQANFLSIYSGRPFNAFDPDGNLYQNRISLEQARAVNRWVADYISYINPEKTRDLKAILDFARMEVVRRGINCLVIDPWNCIVDERPAHMSETNWVNHAMFTLKLAAQELNIHVALVAHPTKMRSVRTGEPEPIPSLTDISGSINFRNQCDFGFVVHRDQGDALTGNRVMIAVKKIRLPEMGQMGQVAYFDYEPPTARFLPRFTAHDVTHQEAMA
jgi:twinkle protein